jgi:UDP-GlcNAc:undecaprenyl-phosphate GlcNAc-1-phosphate transferase
LRAGKSPFASDKEHIHHRIMRSGNSQVRTTFIMYLWTATISFPVSISAFTPLWVAGALFAVMLTATLIFSRRKKKSVARS